MAYSIAYFILAVLGLGILVFIHELGHYFVARREGMRVEVFSIGFGKPILSWSRKDVKWQVGLIPFGGYVKIAGMEKKGGLEPHQIEDGFYGKKPFARIRVALAGPIVNIVFAFILFCVIWASGGREKPFSEYTHLLGWVEPNSGLFAAGVRAGDEITRYGKEPFQGFNQILAASLLDEEDHSITGYKINYETREKLPFVYQIEAGQALQGLNRYAAIAAVVGPAGYLIYKPDLVMNHSPIRDSGIEKGDRVIWADGELVFSRRQLSFIVNQPKTLLTVKRKGTVFLTKVPRLKMRDLRLRMADRMELMDWAHASGLSEQFLDLYFIPYNLTTAAEVVGPVAYVDENAFERKEFVQGASAVEIPLEAGDEILAVDGAEVSGGQPLLESLQKRFVQLIVQRGDAFSPISWQKEDEMFLSGVSMDLLKQMISSIGQKKRIESLENLRLLRPVEPKPFSDLAFVDSVKGKQLENVAEQKKQIAAIKSPAKKRAAEQAMEQEQKKLVLGGVFEDRKVFYNPSPWVLFENVCIETGKTLKAFVTGYLSPKYMSGPVGIVGAMQYGWALGVKEALFWMALVSINLGFVNLLPIPVLDGGHICFALYEAIMKKSIKAKTMERLIIPFMIAIVAFFLYLTYQDILRLFFQIF
jgi:regulator of sigma E protease